MNRVLRKGKPPLRDRLERGLRKWRTSLLPAGEASSQSCFFMVGERLTKSARFKKRTLSRRVFDRAKVQCKSAEGKRHCGAYGTIRHCSLISVKRSKEFSDVWKWLYGLGRGSRTTAEPSRPSGKSTPEVSGQRKELASPRVTNKFTAQKKALAARQKQRGRSKVLPSGKGRRIAGVDVPPVIAWCDMFSRIASGCDNMTGQKKSPATACMRRGSPGNVAHGGCQCGHEKKVLCDQRITALSSWQVGIGHHD